jgi:hypothetical protein
MLKWDLTEVGCKGVSGLAHLVQDWNQWRTLVNALMDLRVL